MTEENKRKKEYLERYQFLDRKIDLLLEEKSRVMSMSTRVTQSFSDMPKGGGDDKIQRAVDRLCELDAAINAEVDHYVNMRGEIMATIGTVGNPLLEEVLYHRYVNPKTRNRSWNYIGRLMGYSDDHAKRLYGWALLKLRI